MRCLRAATVLLCGALLAGCQSTGGSADARPLVELGTARAGIDGLLDGTARAISPHLKSADDAFQSSEHAGADNRPDGTAQLTRHRYVLTKVAQSKQQKLLETVRDYWKAQGYRVNEIEGLSGGGVPSVSARTPEGISVGAEFGAPGNVTISSVAWVKDPQQRYPFGSDGSGTQSTVPTFEDPAWSH